MAEIFSACNVLRFGHKLASSSAGILPAKPPRRRRYILNFLDLYQKPLNSGVNALGSITVGVN